MPPQSLGPGRPAARGLAAGVAHPPRRACEHKVGAALSISSISCLATLQSEAVPLVSAGS